MIKLYRIWFRDIMFGIICIKDILAETNQTRKFKTQIEQAKITANCTFLERRLVNPSIWTVLLTQQRINDCVLHKMSKTYAYSVSLLLQPASEKSACLKPATWG